jgi:1-phosphatidylinositol-4-phosphate 5-kinase
MMNVFSTNKQIHVRFDLKGSTLNREVLSKNEKYSQSYKDILGKYSYSLKDIDFDYFKKHIYIDNQIYGQLIEQLNQDSLLLKECNINDYSLLLGIHKNKLHSNASDFLDNINDDDFNQNVNKSQLSFNDIDKVDICDLSLKGRNINTNRKLKEDSSIEMSSITSINCYNSNKNCSQDKLSKEEYDKSKIHSHKIVLDDNGIYNEKYKEIYYIGIIDILTNYDGLKMCEFCYKSVRYCTNKMSCIAPGKYQERFIKYLRQKILPSDQDSEEEGLVKINRTNTFGGGKKVYLEKKLNISTHEDYLSSKNKSEMILNKPEIFYNAIN